MREDTEADVPDEPASSPPARTTSVARVLRSPGFLIFAVCSVMALVVGRTVPATWTVEEITRDVQEDERGRLFYLSRGKPTRVEDPVPWAEARLGSEAIAAHNAGKTAPEVSREFVYEDRVVEGVRERVYLELVAKRHWGIWSLLPAVVAVGLCWLTREPVTALTGGIVAGAFLLGRYDLTEEVLVPSLATKNAAGVLILYLWLLGGLMGIWSRTGAAQAFAELMTRHVVRGPRTAKLVAWFLGVIFFQGGTVSTVLVGTTVKPLADREGVSHEELAYVVDSTASPIASQLAFNAWPGYVQSFIFVAGVSFLATEADRIRFFFQSVPFCFYAIFAVLGTFLLAIEKPVFLGKKLEAAIRRSRESGDLDADGAEPLSAPELQASHVPEGYTPHVIEFFAPLLTLIGIAIGTFVAYGSPNVRWAFGAAVLVAMTLALLRGMRLKELMEGFGEGIKGTVLGTVILLLAITIGSISKDAGGGIYLVELLGDRLPYWALPVMLQVLTIVISFSTGTSWGTYAVAFPLAMPLAWAVANGQGLERPELFMTVCFAAVMDWSVFGDQCSPISDTTVLSSMCCGCDLMDHVTTQIPQASVAAGLAAIAWTLVALVFT